MPWPLKKIAAVKILELLWLEVDKKPIRQDSWYPSYVLMMSAIREMKKKIGDLMLPIDLVDYLLQPITDFHVLEKRAEDIYSDFEVHPSEFLKERVRKREGKPSLHEKMYLETPRKKVKTNLC